MLTADVADVADEAKKENILRDWKGNEIDEEWAFGFGSAFYPLSASKLSQRFLKRYDNNPDLAFERTGLTVPLTFENVKGKIGLIYKRYGSTIAGRKPKLVFP